MCSPLVNGWRLAVILVISLTKAEISCRVLPELQVLEQPELIISN
jgi:hypothetical protein